MSDEDPERAEAVRLVEAGIGDVFSRFRRLMMQAAERLHPGLHPVTYKTFSLIVRRAPVTASTLSEWLEMDKAQVSRAVKDLEQLGLVTRRPDDDDRRSFVIEPTDEGRERLEAARTPHEETLRARLDAWDIEDVRRLGDLLHALAGPVDESAERTERR